MTKVECSWAMLANAVIQMAEYDIKKQNQYRNDAEIFLTTAWCSNLREMIRLKTNRSCYIYLKPIN